MDLGQAVLDGLFDASDAFGVADGLEVLLEEAHLFQLRIGGAGAGTRVLSLVLGTAVELRVLVEPVGDETGDVVAQELFVAQLSLVGVGTFELDLSGLEEADDAVSDLLADLGGHHVADVGHGGHELDALGCEDFGGGRVDCFTLFHSHG